MKKINNVMKHLLLGTTLLAGAGGAASAQDLFRKQMEPVAIAASDFIGMRVYAAEQATDATEYAGVQKDWDDIGEINDVILTRDGKVDAVLVDIGGFLGMGERQVALGMENIRFISDSATSNDPDDFFLVVNATRAALEGAPDYTRAAADNMATTDGQAATDQSGTVTNDTAMTTAPATDGTAAETAMTGDGMLPEGYAMIDVANVMAEKLVGVRVYGPNQEDVGEISQVVADTGGASSQVIVDVGGFLGIGEKPVALDLSAMTFAAATTDGVMRAYVSMTQDQLEELPKAEM